MMAKPLSGAARKKKQEKAYTTLLAALRQARHERRAMDVAAMIRGF
jgi:hypothetical protein